jgi:hypothetical protein
MIYDVLLQIQWDRERDELVRELSYRVPFCEIKRAKKWRAKVRIAQREYICGKCEKPIKRGHQYIPYFEPIGHSFRRKEAHPECMEHP